MFAPENKVIIDSGNGLSPVWCQATSPTNFDSSSIALVGTQISGSFMSKYSLKGSYARCRPYCSGLNALKLLNRMSIVRTIGNLSLYISPLSPLRANTDPAISYKKCATIVWAIPFLCPILCWNVVLWHVYKLNVCEILTVGDCMSLWENILNNVVTILFRHSFFHIHGKYCSVLHCLFNIQYQFSI